MGRLPGMKRINLRKICAQIVNKYQMFTYNHTNTKIEQQKSLSKLSLSKVRSDGNESFVNSR